MRTFQKKPPPTPDWPRHPREQNVFYEAPRTEGRDWPWKCPGWVTCREGGVGDEKKGYGQATKEKFVKKQRCPNVHNCRGEREGRSNSPGTVIKNVFDVSTYGTGRLEKVNWTPPASLSRSEHKCKEAGTRAQRPSWLKGRTIGGGLIAPVEKTLGRLIAGGKGCQQVTKERCLSVKH